MNAARLIKLAPTLILVGCMGYALFAMESGIPGAGEAQAEMQKGLDRMVQDVLAEGSTAAKTLEGKLRDPFWAPPAPPAAVEAAREAAAPQATDPVADLVRGMSLEATMLHGKDQLAVIDGRIYARGQRVPIPGDEATPDRSLLVLNVTRTGVLLKGESRLYHLVYPDQLGKKKEADGADSARQKEMAEIDPGGQMEMFQKLLNSPLGAMGRGLIGDAASRGGPSAKGRGRPGADPRARKAGAGGP